MTRALCAAAPRRPLGSTLVRRDDLRTLVHRAAAGDERAWTLLVGRFDATIRQVARRHGLTESDRDEVAQRTWCALLRHIDRVHTHPALAGWLITTARRECLRVLAAGRRERPTDTVEDRVADDPALDERLLAEERHRALHAAIDRVPEHERRLLRLMLSRPDLSYDEIGALLDLPKGSIGPTRGRCVARLRGDCVLVGVVHGRPAPGHDLA
jgi:RNA polymerase sigma factor (sigma-70 family)